MGGHELDPVVEQHRQEHIEKELDKKFRNPFRKRTGLASETTGDFLKSKKKVDTAPEPVKDEQENDEPTYMERITLPRTQNGMSHTRAKRHERAMRNSGNVKALRKPAKVVK